MILLDTNLLTRLTRTAHPHGGIARTAVQRLLARTEQIAIIPQNLYEFWAVATRNPGARPVGENGLRLLNDTGQPVDRLLPETFHANVRPR